MPSFIAKLFVFRTSIFFLTHHFDELLFYHHLDSLIVNLWYLRWSNEINDIEQQSQGKVGSSSTDLVGGTYGTCFFFNIAFWLPDLGKELNCWKYIHKTLFYEIFLYKDFTLSFYTSISKGSTCGDTIALQWFITFSPRFYNWDWLTTVFCTYV